MLAAATLKAKTAAAHQRAEDALNAGAIRRGDYSLADYQRLMRANHASWQAAADWIDAHFKSVIIRKDRDLIRRQLEALELDLKRLGVTPLAPKPLAIPGNGEPELMGLLYVMRGSTLGGAMIARLLPASPELTQIDAFHFYRACGNQPAGHWKDFLARLNEALVDKNDLAGAVAAATIVFDHLYDRMCGH